ncbi:hypothetical protein FJY70_05045, partial [candidate division WOR-3 bacterium]|nr:hypothetical protein [candidate division WOR-3 bacterium]
EFTRGLNLPTLGICFGHQLLARAFGGRVLSGELIKRHETVELAQTSPLFYDLGPKADFVESHREYVDPDSILPAGWQVSARSGSCPVEAMSHPTRPLLGVQFHPERSGANGEKLLDNFYRRIVASFTRSRAPEAAIP